MTASRAPSGLRLMRKTPSWKRRDGDEFGKVWKSRQDGRTKTHCVLKAFQQVEVRLTVSVCRLILFRAPLLRKCAIMRKLKPSVMSRGALAFNMKVPREFLMLVASQTHVKGQTSTFFSCKQRANMLASGVLG